jgi:hypothetical protein
MFVGQALKTVSYLGLALMLSIPAYARIVYEYDAAGNRVLRKNEVSMQAKKANADEQTTDIFEEELPEMKISIFPNPTKGILQIEISNANTLQGVEIRLYNPQGALIRQLSNLSEMTTLDISEQSGGIYIMQIVLNDNEISTWKIIKN